jgi:ankyrin repeat protein
MSQSRTRASMPALFAELDNRMLVINIPVIKSILEKGELTNEDIKTLRNYTDSLGFNSIHYAAQELTPELVRLLTNDAAHGYVNTKNPNGITPLHMAIHGSANNAVAAAEAKDHSHSSKELRKIPTLKALLENNHDASDPNLATTSGTTALHLSATEGQYAISALLLQHDADVNLPNKVGNLPLHLAANSHKINSENIKLIELLASVMNNINAENDKKETPLDIAYKNNRFDIIAILLQHGASPSIKTTLMPDSILKNQAEAGTHMFIALLEKSNGEKEKRILHETLKSSSSSTRKAFFTYLINEFLDSIKQMAKAKQSGHINQETLVRQTILDIIISLIPPGEDNKYTNEFSDAFFDLAKDKKRSAPDRDKLIQLALDPDALNVGLNAIQEKINTKQNQGKIRDVLETLKKDKTDQYPIHTAIENGLAQNIIELIDHNQKETLAETLNKVRLTDHHTALSLALEKHMWETVILLLNKGAATNLPVRPFEEASNKNILHLAIEDIQNNALDKDTFRRVLETLKHRFLLQQLTVEKSKAHESPISAAIKTNDPEIVTILQTQSEQIGLFLDTVTREGSSEILDVLSNQIPASKNIDSYRTEEGETLLHVASSNGSDHKVAKLIGLGADVNVTTLSGNSALHIAATANALPVIQLLLKQDADPFIENNKQQNFLEVLIDNGIDIEPLVQTLDKKMLFRHEPTKDNDANHIPSLLSHLLHYYVSKHKILNSDHLKMALISIAKVDPESFYKEFKAQFNRRRAESNSGKLTPEEKLALLKRNKKLCDLVQLAEEGLESLRKVKFHSFMKSPLPAKLISEKKDLTEKIEVLDRMIQHMEDDKFAVKKPPR